MYVHGLKDLNEASMPICYNIKECLRKFSGMLPFQLIWLRTHSLSNAVIYKIVTDLGHYIYEKLVTKRGIEQAR